MRGLLRDEAPNGLLTPMLRGAQSGKLEAMDFVRILFAILLPPLGVFLQVGIGKHFWINILLTLLGYIPGIVHAVYIIAKVGPRTGAR